MNNIDEFLDVTPSFSMNNSYLEQLSYESSPEYVLEFNRKPVIRSFVDIIERSKSSQLYTFKLHTDVSLITKENQVMLPKMVGDEGKKSARKDSHR